LQLAGDLEDKTKEVEDFDDRIAVVTKGIDTIQDTINTDPELLRKYSRVYFLSENYVPTSLSQIDPANTYHGEADSIHSKAKPFLDRLLAAAKKDGIDILITSAYRSFAEQKNLNDQYSVIYGAGTANQFSAEQGYSEHQLGTTVDFVTAENDDALTDSFDTTKAFEWLEDHAYRYGFVLSYPEGNSYYEYEPWHWRFVGEDLADDLHDEDAYFYDWDQRQIDTYRADFWKD
jgi:D-alanyl-D-alanine carboxypeptidase